MRGFWHTLDAVIAALIITSFFAVAAHTVVVTPGPENLNERAYDLLQGLDEQGILRDYVVNLDTAGLDSEVMLFAYNHSVEICDYSGACTGTAPEAKNVWVGSYLIAGKDSYNPHLVRLYIW